MSCNGCRVLRKGCSDTCILRPSLQWIDSAEAQGHATVFVAKFFGRAGLMSFISAVPETQRPALFQSLLFEAAGRTVNPVNGAVGLMWTGNWKLCQAAVETVLRGGALKPIPHLIGGGDASECAGAFGFQDSGAKAQKRRRFGGEAVTQLADLDLSLMPGFSGGKKSGPSPAVTLRVGSPSMNSEESVTTTCGDRPEIKILNLFN